MPSSDYNMISKVLDVVCALKPASILDVGCGNGRYGFLFRECLDWNQGRFNRDEWLHQIEAVEIDESYITPVHTEVYNDVFIKGWLEWIVPRRYNLIFMGDVLEHFVDWPKALLKAKANSSITLVVAPNWEGSIAQGAWFGHEHEKHETVLSPEKIGGKCLFANSKMFMCGFDNSGSGILRGRTHCK